MVYARGARGNKNWHQGQLGWWLGYSGVPTHGGRGNDAAAVPSSGVERLRKKQYKQIGM